MRLSVEPERENNEATTMGASANDLEAQALSMQERTRKPTANANDNKDRGHGLLMPFDIRWRVVMAYRT